MLVDRNVKIHIYVRPVEDTQEVYNIQTLEAIGVKITYIEKMHQAAITDRDIAWEGSLNILQHWDSHEQMTRHTDEEYIRELLGVLDID